MRVDSKVYKQKSSYNKKASQCKAFISADRTGLEPATSAVTGQHSNQLNYRSIPTLSGVQI